MRIVCFAWCIIAAEVASAADKEETDPDNDISRVPRAEQQVEGGECTSEFREFRASFSDGVLSLPPVDGAAGWTARAMALFGAARVEWTWQLEGIGAAAIVVPPEAIMTPLQSEWLTRVVVFLDARDADGHRIATAEADPFWFAAQEDGSLEWFDIERQKRDAPVGALSAAARATVAAEVADGADWVQAPYGGAR